MGRKWRLALAALALATAAAAVGSGVTVLVNGARIDGPYRLEKGVVVGPVAPVAKALGGSAEWLPGDHRLDVARNVWRHLSMESLAGRALQPYDAMSLGPVLAVRQKLAAEQAAWFAKRDLKQPLLARYEITGAINWYSGPMSGGPDTAGFTVVALLYYVQAAEPPDARIGTIYANGGGARGPKLNSLEVRQVSYHLAPNKSESHPAPDGGTDVFSTAWEIDGGEEPEVLKRVDLSKGENSVLPMFDVSALDL
jgi:hypothetical protein